MLKYLQTCILFSCVPIQNKNFKYFMKTVYFLMLKGWIRKRILRNGLQQVFLEWKKCFSKNLCFICRSSFDETASLLKGKVLIFYSIRAVLLNLSNTNKRWLVQRERSLVALPSADCTSKQQSDNNELVEMRAFWCRYCSLAIIDGREWLSVTPSTDINGMDIKVLRKAWWIILFVIENFCLEEFF